MSGATPPLLQYAFIAWCSVKAQEYLYFYLYMFSVKTGECTVKCCEEQGQGHNDPRLLCFVTQGDCSWFPILLPA